MVHRISGFMDFIREQGVVGLAVGLTLGTSITLLVNSIVNDIVNPLVGVLLPGSGNLNTKYVCLDHVNGVCTNKLAYGAVLSALISFMTIAALIYFVVKGLGFDKFDKKKEVVVEKAAPKEESKKK